MNTNTFRLIDEGPNLVKIHFGKIEEITSKRIGAEGANVAKVSLWGPDILHYHKEAEETYVFTEGEGEIFLDGEIFEVSVGVRVIIKPGTLHAARPGDSVKEIVFLCVSSPPFNPDDVYTDPRGYTW